MNDKRPTESEEHPMIAAGWVDDDTTLPLRIETVERVAIDMYAFQPCSADLLINTALDCFDEKQQDAEWREAFDHKIDEENAKEEFGLIDYGDGDVEYIRLSEDVMNHKRKLAMRNKPD